MFKIIVGLLINMILGKLKPFAIDVVSNLNSETFSNEEKRSQAFNLIKDKAILVGKELRDSLVGLAIELIVTWLKK